MPEATEMKHFFGQGGGGRGSIKRSIRYLQNTSLNFLQMAGYASGLMRLMAAPSRAKGAIILMYHSVTEEEPAQWIDPTYHVPADIFARQMAFLAFHRHVVSLAELIDTLRHGQTPPAGTVVITFDDGYLDNLTVVAPILDRYNLPATLFLPTGYIDRGENQWVDQAYSAFKHRSKNQLAWDEVLYDLSDPMQNHAAYRAVCKDLLTADPEKRREKLNVLRDQLQPTVIPPRLTMTWTEVRTLLRDYPGFSIGAHTLEHTDLTSVDEAESAAELSACANKIEAELGARPRHFSFCYGRTSETLRRLAEEAGFEAACGGGGLDPVIQGPADLFRLPRVAGPPAMERFALKTSSANTGFWRRLGQ